MPKYIIYQEIPCTECDGSKIIIRFGTDERGKSVTREYDCPRCNGKGTELMQVDLMDVLKELDVVFHEHTSFKYPENFLSPSSR